MAAALALAQLAKEDVPESVSKAYNNRSFKFGREYYIPTPFDPRLITRIPIAVAKAAIKSGVAKREINDWEDYERELLLRIGTGKL